MCALSQYGHFWRLCAMDISHACLAHSPGTGSPGTTTGIYLPDCNGPHNGPPVHHYHQIIRNQRHISTTAWQQLHAAFSMPNVTECRSSVNSKKEKSKQKENQNITSSRCFTKKTKFFIKGLMLSTNLLNKKDCASNNVQLQEVATTHQGKLNKH